MTISGALAGLMATNELMGVQHRLTLGFTGGYGFVGIAVALMGRNHPLGIVLAAVLFGALYQGGSELTFDMPRVNRDMVVVIQGLVILFAGALENMFRPAAGAARPRRVPRSRHERRGVCPGLLGSTVRLAVPLVLAALAGLFAERSGVVDIGLEGKMLGGAFAAAAAAQTPARLGPGSAAAVLFAMGLSMVHGFATITNRGDQVVSGMALNIMVAGLGPTLADAWFGQAGRVPVTGPEAASPTIELPFAQELAACRCSGPSTRRWRAAITSSSTSRSAVPLVAWVVYKTRFGLRLRAVGENPAAVDTAGIAVEGMRYRALC